jgi:cyclase
VGILTQMSNLKSDITEPGTPELSELSPGIYAYIQPDGTWWINNTGFMVGPQGVISIDTCSTSRRTQAYLDAIAAVTDARIRAVVNTHHHGDHTFGNCMFPGAAIIGHERTRSEAVAFGPPGDLPFWDGPDWGHLTLDPPFITFTEQIMVHAGDLRAQVRHVGTAAHTTNDSIVWIPDRSVLFCGDLIFNGGTPFLLMGSVAGAIDVLENVIRPLGAQTIVPGHGPVFSDSRPIDDTLDYLRFVLDLAARSQRDGLSPLEAARKADLDRFANWADAERIVGNLHRAYAENDGAAQGSPIDVITALTDMVAYNGGAPLTCLA